MKQLITQNLSSSNSLYRIAFSRIVTSVVVVLFPIFFLFLFYIGNIQEKAGLDKQLAIQNIIKNSLVSSSKYGDLIYSRASSIELGKNLGLMDLGICNQHYDLFERLNETRCKKLILKNTKLTFDQAMLSGKKYDLEFRWKNERKSILSQISFSLLLSLVIAIFLMLPLQIVLLHFIVSKVQGVVHYLMDLKITSEKKDSPEAIKNEITLFNEFLPLEKFIHGKVYELKIALKDKVLSDLAKQVSHDIRSPLAALNMIMEELTEIPEKNRIIIRSSVNRINDIANQLLEKGKTQTTEKNNFDGADGGEIKLSVELLSPLIDSLVSLKRVQFREKQGIEIEADINSGYGLFANINPTELHRTLSNILNNSIEAMSLSKGKVGVSLRSDEQGNVLLIVKDNGKGIPAHILAKLGEMGVSHGKEGTQSGSGLGVYHAKKTIESFGGKFDISSIENQGTTITMIFPKAQAPKWFVEKLSLSPLIEVVSLDDDLSIHQIWKGRFESMNASINHLTFTSGPEFKNFINLNKENKKRLYLIDFELLNQNQTGLDIIEELNIGPQSILVTSRYEEESIRSRCENLSVKLIPKTMAGFVPIEIEAPKKLVDIILIDDDELIHLVWQSQAKKLNKSFIDFYSFDDFLKRSGDFDLNSTIYIDSNLKNGVKGEEVSKIAYELGFKNIYLCTGFEASSFPAMPWIKGIMGKELKF